MNYGKGHWPILDQALFKKATDYNMLVEGIVEELSTINGIADFCEDARLSENTVSKIIHRLVKPKPKVILQIVKALVIQRNYYRSQNKHLKNGIQS